MGFLSQSITNKIFLSNPQVWFSKLISLSHFEMSIFIPSFLNSVFHYISWKYKKIGERHLLGVETAASTMYWDCLQ